MGKPVLANAKCDVLQGQCLRSNAGLFYGNYAEFAETMRAIDTTPSLQAALGRNGRAFFERHYAWPVIEKKYVDMLQQLSRENSTRAMEPMPGWFARRRRSLPPALEIVQKLPAGPYREQQSATRNQQPAISNQQSATGSRQSAVGSRQPAVRGQQPADNRPPRREGRDVREQQRRPRPDQQRDGGSPQQPPRQSQPRPQSPQQPQQPQRRDGSRDDQQRRRPRRGRRPQGRGNR
jgi:hypothetical protein